MQRRSANQNSGSLDLLLDTICNTFGGILLIALLVIILLNTTSKTSADLPASRVTEKEMLETAIEQDQLLTEIARLQKALKEVDATQSRLLPSELIATAKDLKTLQNAKTQLLVEKSQKVDENAKAQAKINSVNRQNAQVTQDLEEAKNSYAALEKQIQIEIDQRSRTAVIPKVEQSSKDAKTFFLANGRVYGPVFTDQVYNSNDFMDVVSGGQKYIQPNPNGGVVIAKKNPDLAKIKSKFNGISSQQFDIKLFVYPDSFDRYEVIRDVMASLSLKCDLIPLTASDKVGFTPGGEGPRYSQ